MRELRSAIQAAVMRTLDSGCYINGPEVERFESRVARALGAQFAVGVSSGTDALLVALMALDVRPGDLVITSVYSFIAAAEVIVRLSAHPVFIDIERDTYNIDPASLARFLQEDPIRRSLVKAIVPVHLFGRCAPMDQIVRVADRYEIPVVEDVAQAFGAVGQSSIPGIAKCAGTMGRLGCFSFYPTKNLGAMGDGGMVVTDDADLARRCRQLRNHGAEAKGQHTIVGGNFRLDEIQAAILNVKLDHVEAWNVERRRIATAYDAGLRIEGLMLPRGAPTQADAEPQGRAIANHVYNQYVVAVERDRDGLAGHLAKEGIGTAIYYPTPLNRQPCLINASGITRQATNTDPAGTDATSAHFPQAEWAAAHTLGLPIYPGLTEAQQQRVIASVRRYFGRGPATSA
ncbi:MAG: DegT/DnrJ/EryC1/StrS family aminotransferase [Deltaproteobacteria bacterium]|nr:DegT/DnrJ/EryC1/StrS family aminotransferase [Deltaproteobacteria bacterium]